MKSSINYFYIFHKVLKKILKTDVEKFEKECLKKLIKIKK